MRKVRAWFDKYDWGTFIELGELILTCFGAAIWLYFLWLVLDYYLK